MKIPLIYNLRSLRQRPVSTVTTALGMALVVAVFVAMNALANGFQAAMVGTGSNENVLLLRKGATNEMSSALVRQVASIVAGQPFIARDAQGQPLVSPETFVVVPLARRGGLGMANVVARGVSLRAFDVRKNVRI